MYNPPLDCPEISTKWYINTTLRLADFVAAQGKVSPFEASTHIVRSGDYLSTPLRKLMPWTKLVISLREPISRAASMLIHLKDQNQEGCLMNRTLADCLLSESQINGAPSGARTTNYTFPLATWLNEWPREQIHVIQYEELTEEERQKPELDRLKEFIGIQVGVPEDRLGVRNSRKYKIRPKGWKMARRKYKALIEMVRPDVEALLDLLESYGKIQSRESWMERWQHVWEDNLKSCDAETGLCSILLS